MDRAGLLTPGALAVAGTLAIASSALAATQAMIPRALVGTFGTTIGKKDYPTLLPGHETISFDANGLLRRSAPAEPPYVLGIVIVSGNRIVFPIVGHCRTKGTYRWAVHNRILTFTKITDSCFIRFLDFGKHRRVRVR